MGVVENFGGCPGVSVGWPERRADRIPSAGGFSVVGADGGEKMARAEVCGSNGAEVSGRGG